MNQLDKQVVILGCGYVGRRVAQQWMDEGLSVTATTTTAVKVPELERLATQALVLRGDDASALEQTLADQDVVLVAIASGRREYRSTYLATAQTLVKVLPNTSVRQVIYTSSFSVYGNHGGHWVTEETAIAPTTEGTQIMADAEQCLLDLATPERAMCVLRLGGIYGPGRELLKIFRRRSGTEMQGDGKSPSNWVHVDDIVGAIAFARTQRLQGIYNVVQDTILSRRDFFDRLFQTYNLSSVTWNPEVASGRSHNVKVSNQKLKEAGYSFVHTDFWLPPDHSKDA